MLTNILLMLLLHEVTNIETCHAKCICNPQKRKVSCNDKNITTDELKLIVEDLPLNLTELLLIENRLVSFPTSYFENFTSLETLDLGNNMLTEIPSVLPSIKTLKLSSNQIHSISKEDFAVVNNLQKLDLYDNKLTEVGAEVFSRLNQLRFLYLEENLITTLSQHAFARLESLQDLLLSKNKISMLEDSIFDDLKNIGTIEIADNQLTRISSKLFPMLPLLDNLYLSNNNISSIEAYALKGVKLTILKLDGNQLHHINELMFYNTTVTAKLELQFNPLECDCRLYDSIKGFPDEIGILGSCTTDDGIFSLSLVKKKNLLACTICSLTPCHHNATCHVMNETSFTCNCTDGYMGETCQVVDQCFAQPCMNNATCANVETSSYECNCTTPYTGVNCSNKIACHTNPCLNGGVCMKLTDIEYECKCDQGYQGLHCQDKAEEEEEGGMKPEFIALIVIALFLLVAVLAVLVYYMRLKRQAADTPEQTPLKEKNVNA